MTATATATAPHFSRPMPTAPVSRASLPTRPSHDGSSQRRIARRMTTNDAALQSAASAHTCAPSDQDISDRDTVRHVSTRRGSWIKRLSSMSHSSSRNTSPSPGPLSPAVSCSNGSMAFSHDRSTVPVPPNKLVKRASSVRGANAAHAQPSATLRPSFRRPATSHQRTATLQTHSLQSERTTREPAIKVRDYCASTDSEAEYTQFFTAKITKERIFAKRASSARPSTFRRIFPDEKHLPTLLLAKSVAAAAEDVDDSTTDDGESVFFMSRPATPLSMSAVLATRETSHSRRWPSCSTNPSDDASEPKRSFSITNFLSSSKQFAARASRPLLSRRASQQAYSPRVSPIMPTRPHSTSYGEYQQGANEFARREIATSAGPTDTGLARNALHHGTVSPPLPTPLSRSVDSDTVAAEALASMLQQREVVASAALGGANQTPPSPTLAQTAVRVSRHSMAPSEQASTLVGSSDNEVRGLCSGDEDDADVQSETLYESLHTGTTRSTTGGARGPRIDTIFDELPPSKVRVTALRDLLPPGSFRDHTINGVGGQQSITEEEESITTPVRTVRPQRSLQDSPSCGRTHNPPLFPSTIPSSPTSMPKPLSLGTLEWDSGAGHDDDSSRWSLEEADVTDPWVDYPTVSHATTPVSLLPHNARYFPSGPNSKPTTPQHLTAEFSDRDARSSIFDWSEQQIADKNSGAHTPPRPRTVHGKKDADRRCSRSVGRRAPSGLHARSQSVPVVPDLTGKRSTVVTNKFGTWGVGSKGVTEDWNDDFDFSELNEDPVAESDSPPSSNIAMVVPKSIQEQQNNVLANISLLREWGLLIEELKEHRVRAVALGIVQDSQSSMWEEVDAMIDLADQEADHGGVAHDSPPSSPGFDEDAFEDPSPSPSHGRGRGKFTEDASKHAGRKSILPPNDGIFAPQSPPLPPKSAMDKFSATRDSKTIVTRPRKDSEAKARSVIEALQKRRSTHELILDAPPTPSSKKVPFDTATLRRIVPYVSTLTHKVKETIRNVEGLYSSPNASPMHEEPPYSRNFQQDTDLAAQMKLMTVM
ncbi:Splicing coactivator [Pyrenophora seminiperda CCB06]|uniref:Splicing coactivator n=1 Tax=Pyrenophora seminiperda CCB06 TaxID=1302712 RepID=A0A3M7M3A8_9PLEO|nr:Splicing coactivator [Pyrenophora seminiperda CCB06]